MHISFMFFLVLLYNIIGVKKKLLYFYKDSDFYHLFQRMKESG